MNSMRRIESPGKGNPRTRYAVFKQRPARMGKAEVRLASALDQLKEGIPLNWGQLEDDPELVTLARLYAVAHEARNPDLQVLPPDLQRDTLERMSKRLPKPKMPVVKVAPKSLAGFSESVPVLTQVEDNINLHSRVPQWIGATLSAGLLVTLAFWWLGNSFFGTPRGNTAWIEVRQGGKPVYAASLPADYRTPKCPAWTILPSSPYVLRDYVPSPDKANAQGDLNFPMEYLPESVTVSGTVYTLTYLDTAVAACEGQGSVSYSSAKLGYIVKWTTSSGQVKLATLSVFEGKQQVTAIDATQGKWRSVAIGDRKGVLWQGSPYKDTSGFDWFGDTILLTVEHGDITTTIVGQAGNGITEELLIGLVQQMAHEMKAPS